jgi:hypothetical protein
MKIGIWFESEKISKSYQRLSSLVQIFNTFEGVSAESFIPFGNYSHLVIASDLIDKNIDLILRQKTNKIFIDGLSEKHIKTFKNQCNFNYGVDYRVPRKSKNLELNTCLWIGFKEDFKLLQDCKNFLKSKRNFICTDSLEETKELNLNFEFTYEYKADFVLATNLKALFEAWVRKIPVISLNTPEIKNEFEKIYSQFDIPLSYKEFFRPSKHNELEDFLEFYKVSPESFEYISQITRDYVLKNHLNYNRAVDWIEVLND